MPHVIRAGAVDLVAAWKGLPTGPWRFGNAISRVEGCFLGRDGNSLLIAGVVIEFGRPVHPHVLVSLRDGNTAVRLWAPVPVERTEPVKRFVIQVATELEAYGAGPIVTTNLQNLL
jgi:hypothetical protein